MKKFLVTLVMLFCLPVFADTMPFYINSIPKGTIGLYQTDNEVVLMSGAEANADIIKRVDFTYSPESMPDGMFALLLNEKKLGFLYVTDIADDGWVEVIYDKHTGAKGWVRA